MGLLIRLERDGISTIAEQRGELLARRFVGVEGGEIEAALAQRLCFAGNATHGLKLSRLASFASPLVQVPMHEAIAVLDLILRADPRLIANALRKVRERNETPV